MIPWIEPIQRKRRRGNIGQGRGNLGSQLQGVQQRQPQQGGNRYMGGSRTTTGPGQQQPQQSFGGGINEAKQAYQGGKNIRAAYNKGGGAKGLLRSGQNYASGVADKAQDAYSGFSDFVTGANTITNADKAAWGGQAVNNALQTQTPNLGLGADLLGGASGPSGIPALTSSQQMFAPGNVGQLGTAEESLSQLNASTTTGASSAASMSKALPYLKIGYDVLEGGPQGKKITGNTYGDAALRTGAAYLTGGWSELAYAFF